MIGGATLLEGRVEVCINHAWGGICDNSWSLATASVVCGQLGFQRAGEFYALSYAISWIPTSNSPFYGLTIACIVLYVLCTTYIIFVTTLLLAIISRLIAWYTSTDAIAVRDSYYGTSRSLFWSYVSCSGSEDRLIHCYYRHVPSTSCGLRDFAGVRCIGTKKKRHLPQLMDYQCSLC